MRQLVLLYSAVLLGTTAVLLDAQTPVTTRPQTLTQVAPANQTLQAPASTIAALQQQVAALQAAVTALQAKTQFLNSDGRNVSIQAPGNILVQAQQQIGVQAQVGVVVQSTQTAVTGTASLALKGNMVVVNGGGRPAAAAGSPVAGNQVAVGSPTVLIP